MGNTFSKVPVAVTERSRQNLSHPLVMTSDFGRLDVVYCNSDIVPGDDISLRIDGFLRGAPMPAPTYGKIDVDIRVFFVPHRILTSRANDVSTSATFSWDNFITGLSANQHPYIVGNSLEKITSSSDENFVGDAYLNDTLRLFSEFGLPESLYDISSRRVGFRTLLVNPFRFYAYQRVWWDWFRDSSLIAESDIRNYLPLLTSGEIPVDVVKKVCQPRYACFKKDYFTTAKLNPQSGSSTAVSETFSGSSEVDYISPSNDNIRDLSGETNFASSDYLIPIQWIRAANALQKYLERNNLAGSRLMERFLARFGNAPSPIALDMSEYLGGSSRSFNIGDITSNNEQVGIDEDVFSNAFATPDGARGTIQGQLGGKMASDCSSGEIKFHAKEFGTLIAIQIIRPNVFYFQGFSRELSRGTSGDRFEYFTPEMENLGYQPVYGRELFVGSTASYNNTVFGYVPRYSDYKFARGIIAGDFVLSGTKSGMDSWHFGRNVGSEFGTSLPSLSPAFTTLSPYPRLLLDRIFSIPGKLGEFDHFNGYYNCDVHMTRPMSASSLPSLDEDLGQHGKTVDIANGGVRM